MTLKVFNVTKVDELFHAKIKYGQLFCFKANECIYVFRPLTVGESEAVVGLDGIIHQTAIEDWIVNTCFIYSNNSKEYLLNNTKFKLVSHIANQIMLKSNIQEETVYKETIDSNRKKMNTIQNIVEILIAKGYSGISPASIKNMTQLAQFDLLAKAEIMTGEGLDLGDRKAARSALRAFAEGATVIGGDISSPEAAEKPDFSNL